jgi:hypothetical protein
VFGFARSLGAAALVIAAAACSPDPTSLLAEKTATATTPKKPALSRAPPDRAAAGAKTAAPANPLLAFFGWQAQRDAGPTRAHRTQVVAKRRAAAATNSANKTAAKPVRTVEHVRSAKASKVVAALTANRRATARVVPKLANAKPPMLPAPAAQRAKTVRTEIRRAFVRLQTDVVVYDVGAGIKTLHRANGTVEEEPFDPTRLHAITAARHSGLTRIMIVNDAHPAWSGSAPDVQPYLAFGAIKAGPR